MIYFPKSENLRKLNDDEVFEIIQACSLIKDKLPWQFDDPERNEFYEDVGMTLDNGVLGAARFFSNKIMLSPAVIAGLCYKDKNGIPNNENSINTVIHELTHRKQMKWLHGIIWAFINIPLINRFTAEKWAGQNGSAAERLLYRIYNEQRIK